MQARRRRTFAACTSPKTFWYDRRRIAHLHGQGSGRGRKPGATSYAWTIDTVAPALSLTAKPPDPSGVSTAHFEFSAADQTSVAYQCQLDAGAFQSCTSPKDFSGLANGTHSFTAKGTDAAGNTGSASYSWSVDTAVPVVTVNQAPLNPTNLTGATFSFTSSKLPSTFECQLDGGGFSVCTSPKSYGPLLAGAHSFQARATDSLGHTGPATTYSWTIDLTPPPTPAISSAPANPSNSSSPSFGFTDGESGVGFQCQLDGGAFVSCGSPKTYSGLADGPHSFNVKAVDPAGNQSGLSGQTWTIDTLAPTITLGTKPVDPTNDTTPDFAFSANETISGGFQCKLDAGAFAACTSPKTLRCDPRRIAHLHGEGERHGGKHGADDLHLDDRHAGADDHPGHEAGRSHQRHHAGLCLQRQRDDLRRLPVQARRRRLRRLHEPEDTSLRPQTDRTPSR